MWCFQSAHPAQPRASQSETDFHWEISSFPDKDLINKSKLIDGLKTPLNINKYAITIDSYSNSQGGRKYGSKACAWIGVKYDILNPNNTGKAIGVLYGRPSVKESLHNQVLLAAEYFGCKVWYEFTSDDYLSYFRERGKIKYLGKFPLSAIDPKDRATADRHFGFPITPFSLTKQLDTGISYFENHCNKIDFELLLKFAKTAPKNVQEAAKSTVMNIFGIIILSIPSLIFRQTFALFWKIE